MNELKRNLSTRGISHIPATCKNKISKKMNFNLDVIMCDVLKHLKQHIVDFQISFETRTHEVLHRAAMLISILILLLADLQDL